MNTKKYRIQKETRQPYKWEWSIWVLDDEDNWLRLNRNRGICDYRRDTEEECKANKIPAYTADTKEDAIELLRNIFDIKETYEYTEEELMGNIE